MMSEPTQLPRLLPYALGYAKLGWPVFPLHTPTFNGSCSCGQTCGNPGKHPRVKKGFKEATTDEATIREWWRLWPDANIGIATGPISDLLVVDVDPKNGGREKWSELQHANELEFLTITVDTGSGGWHLYFKRPDTVAPIKSKANAIKPGIDTRCDGGYVVAAPSKHVSGRIYEFRPGCSPTETELQPCPKWLFNLLYPEPSQPTLPKNIPKTAGNDDGWLLVAFKAAGMFRRDIAPDRAAVVCPWESEHSNKAGDNDSSTIVFRPSPSKTLGHFHCSHAHCSTRTASDVRSALPEKARSAADKAYPPKPQAQTKVKHETDWQANLKRKTNGEILSCATNSVSVLSHDEQWAGVIARDDFAGRTIFRKPPPWYEDDAPSTPHEQVDDTDDVRVATWLHRKYDLKVSTQVAHDAIEIVAQKNSFHPVREYLTSLVWDGVQRLPTFAQTYLNAEAEDHYLHAPKRWFIAAVRRIFEPGCQCDSILVLEGGQGLGKSRLLRTLASDAWFADEIGDPSNKDAADALRGKWIVEIGELRWRKSDEDTRKAFITRRIDHYRPAYGRRAIDIPRQNVLAASTNETVWQTDSTGARRYWVVQCRGIDQAAIERDRDMLWAEAMVRYESKEPSWLQEDEVPAQVEALENRREVDPWEERVTAWLATRADVTIPDILTQCLDMEPKHQTTSESRRVGRILRSLGWGQVGTRGGRGQRKKLWIFPSPEEELKP